jgi:hypothetical protein
MKLWTLPYVLMLVSPLAFGQAEAIFGTGRPYVFSETELDRRFLKTRIHKALIEGTESPACAQVLGGLLAVLAETAPALHARDENFYLDPALAVALDMQMTLPHFPAKAFLAAMVRRVMIDKQMPEAWLQRAEQLKIPTLDLAKLRYLANGVKPIHSFYLTLPLFKDRYEREVSQANSAAGDSAAIEFRDNYLDREVAWNGLTLVDVGPRRSLGKEPEGHVARMELRPEGTASKDPLDLIENLKPPPPLRITARLAAKQFAQLSRIPKNSRVWVRGRLFDVAKGFTSIELRDALLFEDRIWAQVPLLPPGAVAKCPAAMNDLTGLSGRQPGGFGRR